MRNTIITMIIILIISLWGARDVKKPDLRESDNFKTKEVVAKVNPIIHTEFLMFLHAYLLRHTRFSHYDKKYLDKDYFNKKR